MRGIRPAVYTLTHKGLMKLRASLKFTKQKTGKVNLPFLFLCGESEEGYDMQQRSPAGIEHGHFSYVP